MSKQQKEAIRVNGLRALQELMAEINQRHPFQRVLHKADSGFWIERQCILSILIAMTDGHRSSTALSPRPVPDLPREARFYDHTRDTKSIFGLIAGPSRGNRVEAADEEVQKANSASHPDLSYLDLSKPSTLDVELAETEQRLRSHDNKLQSIEVERKRLNEAMNALELQEQDELNQRSATVERLDSLRVKKQAESGEMEQGAESGTSVEGMDVEG
ncbi:MAG: hypothetical protein Q9204_003676 [Flavoplaca sp. TL-2023a]